MPFSTCLLLSIWQFLRLPLFNQQEVKGGNAIKLQSKNRGRSPSVILCVLYEMKWTQSGKWEEKERQRHPGEAANGSKNRDDESRRRHARVFARVKVTVYLSGLRTEDTGLGIKQTWRQVPAGWPLANYLTTERFNCPFCITLYLTEGLNQVHQMYGLQRVTHTEQAFKLEK